MTSRAALADWALALWTAPQPPAADAIIAQASGYLARYDAALSALVAEEEYTQKLLARSTGPTGRARCLPGRRSLDCRR